MPVRRDDPAKRWLGVASVACIAVAGAGLFFVFQLRQQVSGLTSGLDVAKADLAGVQRERTTLRQELASVRVAEAELRQRLRDSEPRGVRTAELTDLRGQLDRAQLRTQEVERDNASLRDRLEKSQAAASAAEVELRQRQRDADARGSARPIQVPVALPPGPPSQFVVQTLIRDAETRLAQRRFEAARTIVESVVLRLDPGNAQAGALLERIRARELQYMRDETTLK